MILQKSLGLFLPLKNPRNNKNAYAFLLTSRITKWGKNHLQYLTRVTNELVYILQINIRGKNMNQAVQGEENKVANLTDTIETSQKTIERLKKELALALEEYSHVRESLEKADYRIPPDLKT